MKTKVEFEIPFLDPASRWKTRWYIRKGAEGMPVSFVLHGDEAHALHSFEGRKLRVTIEPVLTQRENRSAPLRAYSYGRIYIDHEQRDERART